MRKHCTRGAGLDRQQRCDDRVVHRRSGGFRFDLTQSHDGRPSLDVILPFVLQFHGRPSTHLWGVEEGVVREIQQGEGGEQGDPLMPALFALWQHQALVAEQETLQPTERLLAFLGDVYVPSVPARIATVEESL